MTPDEAAEPTIEEEVTAALEAHKAAETAPEPEAVTEAPEAADDAPGGPARGPDGKFVSSEPVEAPEEPEQPAIPDKLALAPQYAKAGIKAKWAELPIEVRQELHERESEFHKQLTRYDEDRNFGKQIKQVVAPYEGFIRSVGADPIKAVDYLIKTDYALRTAPPEQRKALFVKAAADYGIQLGDGDFLQSQTAQVVDPRVETLSQRLERLESEQRAAIEQRQLAEQQSIEQQIADFASKPENVFFDRVQPTMAALLESGRAGTLEEAYDMAVHADPETRALQLAAQQQQSQRTDIDLKRAEAERAKRASVSVTGAPGTSAPASSPTNASATIEDDIRAALASVGRI